MENDLLRAARKVRHWTQEELAELVGVSTRTIIRWEKGEAIPQPFYRNKLCEVFQLLSEELGVKLDMDEPEEKNEPPEQGQRSLPARPEQPSTYFVQDRSNNDEMERLVLQDALVTNQMGGVLPEQADPTRFQRILDVGCGTGGWLIEVAQTYSDIPLLIGVDISSTMVTYAREQAEDHHVSDRVQFQTMDALRMLEFSNSFFDLVNQRFAVSYLRIWDWPKLLMEYQRVLKNNGVVRATESGIFTSNAEALDELNRLYLAAFHQAGYFSKPEAHSVFDDLRLRFKQNFHSPKERFLQVSFEAKSPECKRLVETIKKAFLVLKPFLRKWGQLPDHYETIYESAVDQMQNPEFSAQWEILTIWGSVQKE